MIKDLKCKRKSKFIRFMNNFLLRKVYISTCLFCTDRFMVGTMYKI